MAAGAFCYGFFIIGAIILMGISLGTVHWLDMELFGFATFHCGLFQVCYEGSGVSLCIDYDDPLLSSVDFGDLHVVQGLCISAMIFYALTILIVASMLCSEVKSKSIGWAALVVAIIAAVLAFSGAGYFVAETRDYEPIGYSSYLWTYGFSLYLAGASGVLSILAGIFAISVASQSSSHVGTVIQPQPQPPSVVHVVTTSNPAAYPATVPQQYPMYPTGGQMAQPVDPKGGQMTQSTVPGEYPTE